MWSSGEESCVSPPGHAHLRAVVAHGPSVTVQVGVLYLHDLTSKLYGSSSFNSLVTLRDPVVCWQLWS